MSERIKRFVATGDFGCGANALRRLRLRSTVGRDVVIALAAGVIGGLSALAGMLLWGGQ